MAGELKGKKILLVDDDQDILASLQMALADSGASIDMASDGNTAVEKAQANHPDLMVLDLMMPKRSGFLVLESIKKGKTKQDPPKVIMITGNTGMRHRAYADSLGVSKYFNKPFRMDRLVETVMELLS
jgi:DNA-binding response OmpR family regulator